TRFFLRRQLLFHQKPLPLSQATHQPNSAKKLQISQRARQYTRVFDSAARVSLQEFSNVEDMPAAGVIRPTGADSQGERKLN
ncbi:hypothetical protein, partial [Pseudacidovorax sp. RU35E]|uniref:hypothetical protein n=1 Tax=Pseudacidovorax sp. RU35E TaxID=1907403 RepID=UPI001F25D4EF